MFRANVANFWTELTNAAPTMLRCVVVVVVVVVLYFICFFFSFTGAYKNYKIWNNYLNYTLQKTTLHHTTRIA